MKLGLYTSNGTLTCEDLPASLGHEETDARTLAEWENMQVEEIQARSGQPVKAGVWKANMMISRKVIS